jgi:uncharacterized membrane protein YkvA (DUF1232 family)
LESWKARAKALEADTYALYLSYRDPRVAWPAKLVVALVLAYALSPIDLIPDFIPVLGVLDDLVIVPLGLALARRMIPPQVLSEHRAEAAKRLADPRPRSWLGAALVLSIWLVVTYFVVAAWGVRDRAP